MFENNFQIEEKFEYILREVVVIDEDNDIMCFILEDEANYYYEGP